jgi:type IVB pilus formation R64 PilN family outer membrane protein
MRKTLKADSIRNRHYIRMALLLTTLFGFSACDLPQFETQKQIEKKTDETSLKNGPKINAAAGIGVKPSEPDPLSVSNDVWLGNQAIHLHAGKPLPAKFENNRGFTLISAAPLDLRTLAMEVGSTTGIKTTVGDLALSGGVDKVTSTSTTSTPSSSSTTSVTGAEALPSLVETSDKSINVSYSGPLSKFLDQVAAQLDVSWRYDGDSIYFYRYENKTFAIEALSSKTSLTDNFSPSSSGSSGGGSSGGSSSGSSDVTQTNNLKSDMDTWKDIEAALKGILGSDGSEVMVPSDGTVVVTARPAKLDQIAKYLREENQRMTRQIAIDVVAYDVTTTNEDNYGLDLGTAFNYGHTPYLSVSAVSPTSIINPSGATSIPGSFAVTLGGDHWNGKSIAAALSTLGKTVEVTRAPIVTLNNKAASRKIATDQVYIASISSTASTTSGGGGVAANPTVTITPGTVSSGVTLQILPRITTDDKILLQYSIIISSVITTNQTCSNPTDPSDPSVGSNCIGTPQTSNKVFVQQALLQNGSTLVLAGFQDDKGNDQSQGTGSAYNWLMGGVDATNTHQQLVITMTPREITPGRGEI